MTPIQFDNELVETDIFLECVEEIAGDCGVILREGVARPNPVGQRKVIKILELI